MSVFSKIRDSRKAAKEHKDKEKSKEVAEQTTLPYKHTPTHAAVDALSGAPSTWKIEDRPKIKEQHQRRSQLRMSRTASYVSNVSHSTQYGAGAYTISSDAGTSQAPAFPRNSSYASYNAGPAWFDRENIDRERYYPSEAPTQKRRKPTRGHSYHDSGVGTSVRPSPLVSHVASEDVSPEQTPVVSSGNSTNSNSNSSENLEMPEKPNQNRMSLRPQPNVYAEQDIFDRLHTSTTRKLGEAPLYDSPPPVVMKTAVSSSKAIDQPPKKSRWSLRAKKNSAAIAAM
ncbi:hypothetical protein BP6252_05725 [Coleophoma cylindrospora]|uniref:Uncharacterized protein n=1 Tax=Coleophoma cylindrospora TaxID=1849047 RepID=A0A3D8RUA1_9HELO|nr:hypothetical protein BP6252_05725 [Coleophoma cylindrospora]